MFFKSVSKIILYSALAVSTISFVAPANAGSRYGTPPPAVLSQDLTAPWVTQLRIAPARQRAPGFTQRYQLQLARPVYRPVHRPVVRNHAKPRRQRAIAPVFSTPAPQPVVAKADKAQFQLEARFEPQIVSYPSSKPVGTVIIDTNEKYLYLVMGNGQARRYGVGVGRQGFEWTGTNKITRKAQWPDWRPPAAMIAREKKEGRDLPRLVLGGPENPLGARALYLGSTLYRIHGTNSPWTIGKALSSGCIRMRNEDVMDLYERVRVGTRVVVS